MAQLRMNGHRVLEAQGAAQEVKGSAQDAKDKVQGTAKQEQKQNRN